MKLLLYCKKDKNKLLAKVWGKIYEIFTKKEIVEQDALNGRIVGECDFEVEKIAYRETDKNNFSFGTETVAPNELLIKSCLTPYELCQYIGSNPNWTKGDYGYAIHIKNLHIFDEPQWTMDFFVKKRTDNVEVDDIVLNGILYTPIREAPQNMTKVVDRFGNENILISIRPERLFRILNGIKTIEIRKKVLKKML